MKESWVWLLLLVCLGGCGPFHQADWQSGREDLRLVGDVPFFPQEGPYDCGPAALASLLAHDRQSVQPNTIAAEVVSPVLRGSLLPDLENYARRQGFSTRSGRGDLTLLRQVIRRGQPVLIPLEMGFKPVSFPHYVVVFGYDDGHFLVHAGKREGVFIAVDELDRRWAEMNRLYLFLEGRQL